MQGDVHIYWDVRADESGGARGSCLDFRARSSEATRWSKTALGEKMIRGRTGGG